MYARKSPVATAVTVVVSHCQKPSRTNMPQKYTTTTFETNAAINTTINVFQKDLLHINFIAFSRTKRKGRNLII